MVCRPVFQRTAISKRQARKCLLLKWQIICIRLLYIPSLLRPPPRFSHLVCTLFYFFSFLFHIVNSFCRPVFYISRVPTPLWKKGRDKGEKIPINKEKSNGVKMVSTKQTNVCVPLKKSVWWLKGFHCCYTFSFYSLAVVNLFFYQFGLNCSAFSSERTRIPTRIRKD